MTKPPPLWQQATVAQLTSALTCAPYAKDAHKLLVFKGLLLEPSTSLAEAGLRNGCVLHLVLNDNLPPAPARGILVACSHNKARDRGSCGKVVHIDCGRSSLLEEVTGARLRNRFVQKKTEKRFDGLNVLAFALWQDTIG